jgi:hypothetical protein
MVPWVIFHLGPLGAWQRWIALLLLRPLLRRISNVIIRRDRIWKSLSSMCFDRLHTRHVIWSRVLCNCGFRNGAFAWRQDEMHRLVPFPWTRHRSRQRVKPPKVLSIWFMEAAKQCQLLYRCSYAINWFKISGWMLPVMVCGRSTNAVIQPD